MSQSKVSLFYEFYGITFTTQSDMQPDSWYISCDRHGNYFFDFLEPSEWKIFLPLCFLELVFVKIVFSSVYFKLCVWVVKMEEVLPLQKNFSSK